MVDNFFYNENLFTQNNRGDLWSCQFSKKKVKFRKIKVKMTFLEEPFYLFNKKLFF